MGEEKGRTEVSIEQVLRWNPELIIVAPSKSSGVKSCFNYIKDDEKWENIKAVKDGKVYETPYMHYRASKLDNRKNKIEFIQSKKNYLLSY